MTDTGDSLSRLAYRSLEHRIVTLELRPGALVTEKQLIDMAGQGRTPVREAIQKLAWQGLVAVRPRVGLQIVDIRPEDHDHIVEVRRQLEPIAAALVAEHAGDGQRAALLACARTMTDCAVSGDVGRFLAADKVFDEIMEDACPNTFLTAALAPVQTHFRRIWFSSATVDSMDQSISMHVGVIRAIQRGEPEAAASAMQALIDRVSRM